MGCGGEGGEKVGEGFEDMAVAVTGVRVGYGGGGCRGGGGGGGGGCWAE